MLWSVPAHLVWPTRAVLGVGLAALAGSVVAFVARAAGTSGWVLPRAHVLAGVVGLAFGTHDLVSAPVGVPLLGVWLTPYAGGFAIVLSLGASYQHVTRSLARARMRHSDLARLVAEKEAELEQRDAHVRRIERESVLVRERRRLTRELQHDVGADLVAAVAAAESGQPLARAGARIRDALDALRLVVDSLVPAESVIDVLARLRSRMAPSLERRGARIVWRVADLPEVGGFAAEHALCLLRFVHAAFRAVEAREGATTVTVRTGADRGPAGECAFIEVEDDAPAARASAQLARCEATLRAQARRLGGELVTASGDGGTRVRLRVPLSLAPVAPE